MNVRVISKGNAKGKPLVSNEPLSFLGGVDPKTGKVIDPRHPLKGKSIKNKILIIPGGKGSTVGSYVLYQLAKNKTAPAGIICIKAEPIVAVGAIIAKIPLVDGITIEDMEKLSKCHEVEIKNGKIKMIKK
ncbi:predicted aconitase subunit 2 [Methanothermus fervidus DSM 2088]|uniref:Phosphomevalonate dehydratase small subunit n=1 Tax=Methanothermus fervidus (strain ATCC 43054 / DSM 2088 / JCM 10308 / V24 S) TaxID=523846 RepID=E3GYB3_METFV|nr:DUF126 domain-containing protein [Methanothermus fervidus]ADP77295.1 predicted aconitase subunit 2 [Methanothermus fervidus DSM 2088]